MLFPRAALPKKKFFGTIIEGFMLTIIDAQREKSLAAKERGAFSLSISFSRI
jgi:hypothetical protein